jgi:predicted enzyme related to lactoylglutathione lyase
MRIAISSVFVEDQNHALRFYTETLGFMKRRDIPVGEFRYLTVTSPEGPEGIELLLEPNAHPAARVFQQAIRNDGIPATAFFTDDIDAEHRRLEKLGVEFTVPPAKTGEVTIAVFADTCGNLIQLVQE